MHAAVVTSFEHAPRYEEFPEPVVADPAEIVVDVLAAALHPRVRSQADGSHYESTGELPLVPGVDGVGRTPEGDLVYFVISDGANGSMAQRAVVDRRRAAVLPAGVDPATIAATMNPAMSSWIALRRRTAFRSGQSVLVLGATGNAGQLAVQIAKHLGARHVIAAGRDRARLRELESVGADETIALGDEDAFASLGAAAAEAEVDVVIDYLWGTATAAAMPSVVQQRRDRGQPLTWIEIGSMAGLELSVESQWLRAARLQIVGSGQGSVPTRDIVAELPELAAHIASADYVLGVAPTPLSEVETAWTRTAGSQQRTVFVP